MRRYPGESLDDAADRRHDERVQDLVDAEREGRAAGLASERIETNPYGDRGELADRWRTGWMTGNSQRVAKDARRAA